MTSESERNKSQDDCERLISSHKTLLMATRSPDGHADISYAPYVREGNSFYIFVSEMAKHTNNLLAHPEASILFIEEEADACNLFARKRLTLDCQVREVQNGDPEYVRQLLAMTERFGEIVEVLRTLKDFHLLALTPSRGQFVAGFGKTFALDGNGYLQ
ncbi:MAG: pyridoxamine 5'-phosphate oxidase family protein [Methylomonas sp.]|nr:pyridoxamine 5'-phosphate oxidase family protein [Methylomonas sp.]